MTEEKAAPEENGSVDIEKLKRRIIRQVEFYFGDYNLMKDKFMLDKMKENDGWFSMELMLQFKRLASICSEPATILEALQNADETLLEIDTEGQRIRRKKNRDIPEDNEEYRAQVHERTAFVKGFQSEEDIDDIHEFLSEYGKIEGIHFQRLPNKKFKGSLFVTFFKLEDAQKFIQAPMVYYKMSELTKTFRNAYYKQLEEEKKERKKAKAQQEEPVKQKPTTSLKVSGITDDTIIHLDIKQVFEAKGMKNIRFFDRFEQLGTEGYLVFEDDRPAEELLKVFGEEGETKVQIKSAQVEFSKPNDDEQAKINVLYAKAREMFANRSRGRDKQFRHGKQHKKRPMKQQKHQGKKTTFDSDEENGVKGATESVEPAAKIAKTE